MSEQLYHLVAEETQRPDEQVVRTVDVTTWGDGPTSPTAAVWEVGATSSTDVTSTAILSGSPSVASNVISTPVVQSLEDGKRYHLVITFALGSNPALQVYWDIRCTDNRPPAS